MKFNYCFEFTPVEAHASRQVEVIINGTEPKIVDCEGDKVTIELAINERLTMNLINNDDKGEQISKRLIIKDHKVTGAKFEPETLNGTTTTVTKIESEETPAEPPVEPPAPPTEPVGQEDGDEQGPTGEVPLTEGGFPKQSTDVEPGTDPANPDASA